MAIICSSFFTISKAGIENLLTFGEENKLANISLCQQLKMTAKFSPVFVLTTFFRVGCLCSTTMAAGVGSYGYAAVNTGFYGAAFSVPLVLAVPLVVLVFVKIYPSLLKRFLSEVTLAHLVQGVLGEAFTITTFGKAGRKVSRRLQKAMAIFHLCLHTITATIVLTTMPSHRVSTLFNGFAITSLSSGWIAFALFIVQIYFMDKDLNIASKLRNLAPNKCLP